MACRDKEKGRANSPPDFYGFDVWYQAVFALRRRSHAIPAIPVRSSGAPAGRGMAPVANDTSKTAVPDPWLAKLKLIDDAVKLLDVTPRELEPAL